MKTFIKLSVFIILCSSATVAFSQSSTGESLSVQGIVVDETNEPMTGVNIYIKDTTIGTVTDKNGKFNIQAGSSDILVFSFMGYISQEVLVTPSLPDELEIHMALYTDIIGDLRYVSSPQKEDETR